MKTNSGDSHYSSAIALLLGIWFGMATGLAEGISYLVLQAAGWVSWETRLLAIDSNILWASPLVDIPLFVLVACLLWLLLPLLRRIRPAVPATGVFATVAWYTLLAIPGRIQGLGCLMLALGLGVVSARWMNRNLEGGLRFFRSTLIPLLTITTLAALGGALGPALWEKLQVSRLPAPPAGAPNVLLIVLDDLRADHVGAYGYDRPTTPFLDEFAHRSVLFEKAFANSSWSLSSHASLFTGLLPYQHGATLWPYDGRFPTIAQVLASHGYATAGFAANTHFLTTAQGLPRGFQHWENIFTGVTDSLRRTLFGRKFEALVLPHLGYRGQFGRMDAEEINQRLFRWLDRRPARPFFVFLNYMEMHAPYDPPRSYLTQFAINPNEVIPPPRWKFHWRAEHQDWPTDLKLRSIAYDASLAYLDAQIRQLMQSLQGRGLEKDLLVIITSDHGELLGEHDLVGHGTALYLPQIHVPLFIALPSRIPGNHRSADPVGLQSLPATIAEFVGLGKSAMPGETLSACWSDAACGDGSVISELVGGDFPGIERNAPNRSGWIKSIVTRRWQFLLHQNGQVELYDWANDSQEEHNLAGTAEGKPVVQELGDKLARTIPEAARVWAGAHRPSTK